MYLGKINKIFSFLSSHWCIRASFFTFLQLYIILFIIGYWLGGLKIIGLHTNILLPLYLLAVLHWLTQKHWLKISWYESIKFIVVIYLIIELTIIFIRPNAIYESKNFGQYPAFYETKGESQYGIIAKPNQNYHLESSEFSFERTANSFGIADTEWSNKKPEGTVRILCLGDSFTEGNGAVADSTYPAFLKRKNSLLNIEWINAGRVASDPVYDFKLLRDKLIRLQPDIILQSFTVNDLYFDMIQRGGPERFLTNGKMKFSKNYWWEPIYAASLTARILIQAIGGYDKYLIRQEEYPKLKLEAEEKAVRLFREYKDFAEAHQIKLVVFTFPFIRDFLGHSDTDFFHKKLQRKFASFNLNFSNLQPCYEEYIRVHGGTYKDYYWQIDGHHNAKGYEMMAGCIEEILLPVLNSQ